MAGDNPPKDDKAKAAEPAKPAGDHGSGHAEGGHRKAPPNQSFMEKHFNATTMSGRANVAKATYFVVFSLIVYSKFIKPKLAAARAAASAAAQNQCQPPAPGSDKVVAK